MSTNTTIPKLSSKAPLPLSETLRDLALLRASDVDLSIPLAAALKASPITTPIQPKDANDAKVDNSVERSYEFAREARNAVRMLHRGAVDQQGAKVEDVRAKLEELNRGLADDAVEA
jgi:hypothetical protein